MLLLGKSNNRPCGEPHEEDWVVEDIPKGTGHSDKDWFFVHEHACHLKPSYKEAILSCKGNSVTVPAPMQKPSESASTSIGKENGKFTDLKKEDLAELEEDLAKPGSKPAKSKSQKKKGKH